MLPESFYLFVSSKEHIQILNKKNAKFQDAVEIVTLFIEATDAHKTQESQYQLLQSFLRKYIKMYQFVFANLFPRYYSKFNSRGVENNIEFTSFYSNYLNEKNIIEWQQKNAAVYEANPKVLPVNDYIDSEPDSDVVVVDVKKVKKEEQEEAKKQKRLKKKLEMQKQKKNLQEKLDQNTEKMQKIKKKKLS